MQRRDFVFVVLKQGDYKTEMVKHPCMRFHLRLKGYYETCKGICN